MRETKFIEQNQEKWEDFEEMLRENRREPERLNDLFIQITDDLSYARTFYPNRSVRVYLNSLAQQVFHNIYKGRRFPMERLRTFWTEEMPQVMWETRHALWLSFAIFAFAVGIGVVSSMIAPDFARIILGDGYVDMTLENIRHGDPMAVYKQREAFGMSVGIAFNNLWVALLTALSGVLASIGTVFMLLSNGVMLGAFQYFFIERGIFWESFLTIWIHGTLEISAIVIAGAAGLVAGSGLLFPGTYTRTQAFQLSIRRGLKIFIGLIPIFCLAAFFEGFLTRFTETPDLVRLLFILCSLAFVLWYFVVLPWQMAKKGFKNPLKEKELPPDRPFVLDFTAIKTSGEQFSDVFSVVKRHTRAFFGSITLAVLVFMLSAFYFSEDPPGETFHFPLHLTGVLSGAGDFFGKTGMRWLFGLQVAILMSLAWVSFRVFDRETPPELGLEQSRMQKLLAFLMLSLPCLLLIGAFRVELNFFTWFLLVFALPFCGLWAFVLYRETPNPFASFLRTCSLIRWGTALGIGFLLANLGLLLFLFLDSNFFTEIAQFLGWNVRSGEENMRNFMTLLISAFAASFLYLSFWMAMLSGAVQYFSCREIEDAASMWGRIEEIGAERHIRGLARE